MGSIRVLPAAPPLFQFPGVAAATRFSRPFTIEPGRARRPPRPDDAGTDSRNATPVALTEETRMPVRFPTRIVCTGAGRAAATLAVLTALVLGAATATAQPAAAGAAADRLQADAVASFRQARYSEAYGRFAALADAGHAPSAARALWMYLNGPALFNKDWDSHQDQLDHWAALAGQPAPVQVARLYPRQDPRQDARQDAAAATRVAALQPVRQAPRQAPQGDTRR
jgi:hypothetical protein